MILWCWLLGHPLVPQAQNGRYGCECGEIQGHYCSLSTLAGLLEAIGAEALE